VQPLTHAHEDPPTPRNEASRSVLRDKMIQPLSKEDETDAEVTWEDQNNINSFSKLHNKLADLQDLLAEKNVPLLLSLVRRTSTASVTTSSCSWFSALLQRAS
jgi:hypothetical protein